ncbi:LysR family transcriptional regulator [Kribbella sp. NBC_01484]|nr:LysR family transcriptional regulator [Kribbella sp. NBC_01484]
MDLTAAYGFRMDWIVSFVAVARHGGFSAAAKATFRSQSRISEHIAELEKALGVQLFDRTTHPARLTPEGRALVPHAEEILNRLNDLASAGGEVRFGTYPSAAAWLFPQVVRRLPTEIRLHLVEGPSIDLEGALGRGDVDLAIRPVHPLVASESLHHEILWTEPLVAVFQDGHPLAAAPQVSLGELAELPLISIGETSGVRQFESHPCVRLRWTQPGECLPHQPAANPTLAGPPRSGHRRHQRTRGHHRQPHRRTPGPDQRLRSAAAGGTLRPPRPASHPGTGPGDHRGPRRTRADLG